MRMRCLGLFLLLTLAMGLGAASLTGIYLVLGSMTESKQYAPGGVSVTPGPHSEGYLNIFVSLFAENQYEVTLTLAKDDLYLPDVQAFRTRYHIGFELGKLISLPITSRGRRIVSPDFSAGAYYRFQILGQGPGDKVFGEWGFYGTCKVKVNLIRSLIRVNSLDIGYKLVVPVHFGYFQGDSTVLTQIHSLFIGVSF